MFSPIHTVRKTLHPFICRTDLLLQVLNELLVHNYSDRLEGCSSSIFDYTRKVKRAFLIL